MHYIANKANFSKVTNEFGLSNQLQHFNDNMKKSLSWLFRTISTHFSANNFSMVTKEFGH